MLSAPFEPTRRLGRLLFSPLLPLAAVLDLLISNVLVLLITACFLPALELLFGRDNWLVCHGLTIWLLYCCLLRGKDLRRTGTHNFCLVNTQT